MGTPLTSAFAHRKTSRHASRAPQLVSILGSSLNRNLREGREGRKGAHRLSEGGRNDGRQSQVIPNPRRRHEMTLWA